MRKAACPPFRLWNNGINGTMSLSALPDAKAPGQSTRAGVWVGVQLSKSMPVYGIS